MAWQGSFCCNIINWKGLAKLIFTFGMTTGLCYLYFGFNLGYTDDWTAAAISSTIGLVIGISCVSSLYIRCTLCVMIIQLFGGIGLLLSYLIVGWYAIGCSIDLLITRLKIILSLLDKHESKESALAVVVWILEAFAVIVHYGFVLPFFGIFIVSLIYVLSINDGSKRVKGNSKNQDSIQFAAIHLFNHMKGWISGVVFAIKGSLVFFNYLLGHILNHRRPEKEKVVFFHVVDWIFMGVAVFTVFLYPFSNNILKIRRRVINLHGLDVIKKDKKKSKTIQLINRGEQLLKKKEGSKDKKSFMLEMKQYKKQNSLERKNRQNLRLLQKLQDEKLIEKLGKLADLRAEKKLAEMRERMKELKEAKESSLSSIEELSSTSSSGSEKTPSCSSSRFRNEKEKNGLCDDMKQMKRINKIKARIAKSENTILKNKEDDLQKQLEVIAKARAEKCAAKIAESLDRKHVRVETLDVDIEKGLKRSVAKGKTKTGQVTTVSVKRCPSSDSESEVTDSHSDSEEENK